MLQQTLFFFVCGKLHTPKNLVSAWPDFFRPEGSMRLSREGTHLSKTGFPPPPRLINQKPCFSNLAFFGPLDAFCKWCMLLPNPEAVSCQCCLIVSSSAPPCHHPPSRCSHATASSVCPSWTNAWDLLTAADKKRAPTTRKELACHAPRHGQAVCCGVCKVSR